MQALDDIPADETLTLTKHIDRLFRAAGCEPTCHCCQEKIEVGETFKLATVPPYKAVWNPTDETEDVMLCHQHSAADLLKEYKRKKRRVEKHRRDYPNAGYSRPHRSVI